MKLMQILETVCAKKNKNFFSILDEKNFVTLYTHI